MEESALVAKAEKYLKEISNDSISLDNMEEFENFKTTLPLLKSPISIGNSQSVKAVSFILCLQ